jgi:hypothetical protein
VVAEEAPRIGPLLAEPDRRFPRDVGDRERYWSEARSGAPTDDPHGLLRDARKVDGGDLHDPKRKKAVQRARVHQARDQY